MPKSIANWNAATNATGVQFQNVSWSDNSVQSTVFAGAPGADLTTHGVMRYTHSGIVITSFHISLHSNVITNTAITTGSSIFNVATSVMTHELGHAIGLRDNPVGGGTNSIMHTDRNRGIVTSPSMFDRTSASMLYR